MNPEINEIEGDEMATIIGFLKTIIRPCMLKHVAGIYYNDMADYMFGKIFGVQKQVPSKW